METSNFEKSLSRSLNSLNIEFSPGTKVTGMIIAIDRRSVFVDINSKSEGIINREELVDKEGNISVEVGDEIEAYFVSDKGGEITLTVKMTGKFISKHLEDAYYSGIPVEGKVGEERKGGYNVKIADKEAFCPYSQIDLYRKDPENFIGNTFSFIITEMNRFNMVVSRRKLLGQEKTKRIQFLKDNLEVGDLISGTVLNVKNFGVFVDLDGCDGFIPISELAWGRVEDPEEIVNIGDSVKIEVKALDWENNRITLSLRAAQTPWDTIADKYPAGSVVNAKITRLAPFGAFAEIEKGLEGLIHISKLNPGKRINHPKDAVTEGEIVSVVVERVDMDTKRIALAVNFSARASSDTETDSEPITTVIAGISLKGTVEGLKNFGAFVRLTPTQTGLLHISEIKNNNETDIPLKVLSKRYPIGSEVNVTVKQINDGKISLGLTEKMENSEDKAWKNFNKTKKSASFGTSMADAFGDLKL
jgi:small subunit ribosomal protein S1